MISLLASLVFCSLCVCWPRALVVCRYIPSSAAGSGSGSGGDWTKYIPDSAGGAAADGAAKGKSAADEGQAKESQGVTKGVQEQEKHTHPDHSI